MYTVRKGFQTLDVSSFEQLLNMYKNGEIRDNDMVTDLVTREALPAKQVLGVYADKSRSFNDPRNVKSDNLGRPDYSKSPSGQRSTSSNQQRSVPSNQQRSVPSGMDRSMPSDREHSTDSGGYRPGPPGGSLPTGSGTGYGQSSTREPEIGFLHSGPAILAGMLFCFPIGVLLLWTRPRVGLLGNPLVKILLPLLLILTSYEVMLESLPPELREELEQIWNEMQQQNDPTQALPAPDVPTIPGGVIFEWGLGVDKTAWKITKPKTRFTVGEKAVFLARGVSCDKGKLIEVLTWAQGAGAPEEQYERPFDWQAAWDIYTDAFEIEKSGTFTVTLYCGTRETPIATGAVEADGVGETDLNALNRDLPMFQWGTGVDQTAWVITGSKILFQVGDTAHYLVKGISCSKPKVVEQVHHLSPSGRIKQFELTSNWQASYDVYSDSFKLTQNGVYDVTLYCGSTTLGNEIAKGVVVVKE